MIVEMTDGSAEIEVELRRRYEQARQDTASREQLLRDLNHRVGNNMVLLASPIDMARARAAEVGEAYAQDVLEALAHRVMGLAKVYHMLYGSGGAHCRWISPKQSQGMRAVRSARSAFRSSHPPPPPTSTRTGASRPTQLATDREAVL